MRLFNQPSGERRGRQVRAQGGSFLCVERLVGRIKAPDRDADQLERGLHCGRETTMHPSRGKERETELQFRGLGMIANRKRVDDAARDFRRRRWHRGA